MSNLVSSTFARWKSHFTNWREWELNPIVVKELRQSVRSWAVTGMLFLFLLILFATALVMLVTESFESSINQMIGGIIFQAFISILTVASVVFIPLYIGVRVAAERQESNIDLLYVSTLTPGRIIRGKFFCGAYVAILFFSCCMPFMAFTNLLRGVDLPTIFFNLFILFLVVCIAVQAAIFFSCLPITKGLKVLLGLFVGIGIFTSAGRMVFFSFEIMRSGIGAMMSDANFWTGLLTAFSIGAGVLLLLYFLSVALISPPSANRALPVRVFLTVIWLIGGAIAFCWVRKIGEPRVILTWVIPSIVALLAALVVVVSNEDELSLRVLRTVPASGAKRALAFLFYNGAAGGLVWVALMLIATFAMAWSVLHPKWLFLTVRTYGHSLGMGADDFWDFSLSLGSFLIYAFAYALAALFIQRKFLSRRPAKLTGVIAILLPAAWAIIPGLVLFFLNRLSWKTIEAMQPGNMFNVFVTKDVSQKTLHLFCAVGMLLIMMLLNARWFSRQVKRFQRYERNVTPPPVIAETLATATSAEMAEIQK